MSGVKRGLKSGVAGHTAPARHPWGWDDDAQEANRAEAGCQPVPDLSRANYVIDIDRTPTADLDIASTDSDGGTASGDAKRFGRVRKTMTKSMIKVSGLNRVASRSAALGTTAETCPLKTGTDPPERWDRSHRYILSRKAKGFPHRPDRGGFGTTASFMPFGCRLTEATETIVAPDGHGRTPATCLLSFCQLGASRLAALCNFVGAAVSSCTYQELPEAGGGAVIGRLLAQAPCAESVEFNSLDTEGSSLCCF